MVYSNKLKEEIFGRFCDGIPIENLAREYGNKPTKETIWTWYAKDRWAQKRSEILRKSYEILAEDKAKIIAQYIKASQIPMSLYAKKIREFEKLSIKTVTFTDVEKGAKLFMLLNGMATEKTEVGLTTADVLDMLEDGMDKRKTAKC